MSAQTWKTHWATIDQARDPQRYVGQMSAMRKEADDTVPGPFLEFCDLQVGQRVLDVGSGPGWHVRAASRVVGPTGRAVGVDLSEAMVAEARQQAAERGVDVDFVQGSAYALPFEDNTFDRCFSIGMTDILDDPVQAVREMVRVTRPGGLICQYVCESDATYIIPAGAPMTRRLLDFFREHELSHPSGIEVVSVLKSLGTTIEQLDGVIDHKEDFAFVKSLFFDDWLTDAVAADVLTSEEAQQWLADQEAHASEGKFVLGMPNYLIKATKK